MKKVILGAFLLGSIALTNAQTISFSKTTEVYGDVTKGANGDRVFVVKNTGDKPLILSNVKASCGCTTPLWKTDPILPGKSAEIKVGYNTNLVGPFNKQIEVFSNDPSNGRTVLNITGNVLADAPAASASVKNTVSSADDAIVIGSDKATKSTKKVVLDRARKTGSKTKTKTVVNNI